MRVVAFSEGLLDRGSIPRWSTMIVIIYPNEDDTLLDAVKDSFDFFKFDTKDIKYTDLISDFPSNQDIEAILYINFDENKIPKHNSLVFSLVPKVIFQKNINYRITYENFFELKGVCDSKIINRVCMFDVKSMIYNITKILRESNGGRDATRISSVWN